MTIETESFLAEMLPQQRAAEQAIHNGDAEPRIALWSRQDPVTVYGAKVSASGWTHLEPMFRNVASWFSDSARYEFEVTAAGASGELAYTVGFEHNQVKVDGRPRTHAARHACLSTRGRRVAHRAPTRRRPSHRGRTDLITGPRSDLAPSVGPRPSPPASNGAD